MQNASTQRAKLTVVIILGILTLLFLFPFYQNGLVYGDDYLYHLARIQTIADNLRTGDFPVKIHNGMNMGFGYGTGFFYPDFFLYAPALLMCMGISLWNAYKCFASAMAVACIFSAYFCVKHISGSRKAGILMASVYLFSQPYLEDFYGRFAVGECLAFIFVPLVLCGAYNFFYEKFDRPWILGMGFLGLVFSHPVTLVSCLIGMLFACIIHGISFLLRGGERSQIKGLTVRLLLTALVVLLLSISYWLTMLEQLLSGKFHFMKPWAETADQVLTMQEIWSRNEHGVGVGPVLLGFFLICAIGRVILEHCDRKLTKDWEQVHLGMSYMLIGYLILLVTGWKAFWEVCGSALHFLQFPWRMYLYAMAFLVAGAGIVCGNCLRQLNRTMLVKRRVISPSTRIFAEMAIVLIMVFFIACSSYGFLQQRSRMIAGNELLDVCAYSVSNGGGEEWQPDDLSSNELDRRLAATVKTADGNMLLASKEGAKVEFCDSKGQAGYYLIPFVYYKGYQALCRVQEGSGDEHVIRLRVSKDPKTDLVKVEASDAGTYEIFYAGTFLQHLSYFIGVISWLTFLICVLLLHTTFVQNHHRE